MSENDMKKLDKKLQAELGRISEMCDQDIDTSDAPELTDFDQAVIGKFYRPLKRQITLRIDADLLAWFKTDGKGYQTRINEALREFVEHHRNPVSK